MVNTVLAGVRILFIGVGVILAAALRGHLKFANQHKIAFFEICVVVWLVSNLTL